MLHMFSVLTRVCTCTNNFIFYIALLRKPVSSSLGLGRLSLGNQVGQKAVSRLEKGTVCQ